MSHFLAKNFGQDCSNAFKTFNDTSTLNLLQRKHLFVKSCKKTPRFSSNVISLSQILRNFLEQLILNCFYCRKFLYIKFFKNKFSTAQLFRTYDKITSFASDVTMENIFLILICRHLNFKWSYKKRKDNRVLVLIWWLLGILRTIYWSMWINPKKFIKVFSESKICELTNQNCKRAGALVNCKLKNIKWYQFTIFYFAKSLPVDLILRPTLYR